MTHPSVFLYALGKLRKTLTAQDKSVYSQKSQKLCMQAMKKQDFILYFPSAACIHNSSFSLCTTPEISAKS